MKNLNEGCVYQHNLYHFKKMRNLWLVISTPPLEFMGDIPQHNESIQLKMTGLSHRCDTDSLYDAEMGPRK